MTIKEIETRTGLPRASVRYYESEGLISPARGANGYRDYSEEDCTLLLKIKLLRRLGCSLEDVKALRAGTRPLGEVLEERLARLAGDRAELDRAQALCEKLRADGAGWEDLDPSRYLDWTLEPPQPEVPDVRFKIPWRRYFARALDLGLYGALWQIFMGLVFRVNVLQRSAGGKLLDTAAALALMLFLEPLFLHKFGTTPGKAVLGLKLTRSDGSFFDYGEGLERTVQVISAGLGLQVPLVSSVTLLLSYFRCRWGREQPWALEDEAWSDFAAAAPDFWTAKGGVRRALGYVGTEILCELLLLGLCFGLSFPPHRGDLTPAQFAENCNHLLTFSAASGGPAYLLNERGRWQRSEHNTAPVHLSGSGDEPATLTVETEDGAVPAVFFAAEDKAITAVSYTVEDAKTGDEFLFREPPSDCGLCIMAALTGRSLTLLPGTSWRETVREVADFQEGERTWSFDGWTVTCSLEAEGYRAAPDGRFYALDGLEQHFAYRFRMERA